MLVLGLRDAAYAGAETHTHAWRKLIRRKREAGICNRQFGRGKSELAVAIQPLQAMRREKGTGIKVLDPRRVLCVDMGIIVQRCGDALCRKAPDRAFLTSQSGEKCIFADANGGDWTDASDDGSTLHI